jgi:hypothetical protein
MRKKELMLLGAVPHAGKTHFMIALAAWYAKQGAVVGHFYGEDLGEDVREYYQLAGGTEILKRLYLVDMQDFVFDVPHVEGAARQLEEQKIKLDVAIFDNLDIMSDGPDGGSDWEGASKTVLGLRKFVGRHNMIGIAASQAHEKTREKKGQGRFYRAKIGKSSHADVILMVDDVVDDLYYMSRIKARGRSVKDNPQERVIRATWETMEMEHMK